MKMVMLSAARVLTLSFTLLPYEQRRTPARYHSAMPRLIFQPAAARVGAASQPVDHAYGSMTLLRGVLC